MLEYKKCPLSIAYADMHIHAHIHACVYMYLPNMPDFSIFFRKILLLCMCACICICTCGECVYYVCVHVHYYVCVHVHVCVCMRACIGAHVCVIYVSLSACTRVSCFCFMRVHIAHAILTNFCRRDSCKNKTTT